MRVKVGVRDSVRVRAEVRARARYRVTGRLVEVTARVRDTLTPQYV